MNRKLIIEQSEGERIRNMYNISRDVILKRQYVFETTMSVDGRYLVINDDVFDNVLQEGIGYLWDSIDVFKKIFENVKIENDTYNVIREGIISSPILEGKENLHELRDILLEYDFMDGTWVGRQLKSAGEGISDFGNTTVAGVKKITNSISQGDWDNVWSLIKKGTLYVFRSLKDALYSSVGMTIDAILMVTSGLTAKTVLWLPWAMVVGLDIYQFVNNDYPPGESDLPGWLKLIFFGVDVLGLVSSGAIAKSAMVELNALKNVAKSPKMVAEVITKSPKLKSFLYGMVNGSSKVGKMMNSAIEILKTKFPAGAKFLSDAINGLERLINSFVNTINKLLGSGKSTLKNVAKTTAKTGATLYGIETGINTGMNWWTGTNEIQRQNLNTLNNMEDNGKLSSYFD